MTYEMMTSDEADQLISRCDESLQLICNHIVNAEFRVHGANLQRLRATYFKHHRNIATRLDFMAGNRRPQLRDPVCGTLLAGPVWIRFHGAVTRSDERFHVSVQFFDAEHMDVGDGDDESRAAKYIGVEIRRHAADFEWNDVHNEWDLTL